MLTTLIVTSTLAWVTRYNDASSCHNRTKDGLCQTASGYHTLIGSVACPRAVPLGTIVKIGETKYVCLDRTAKSLDGRYDIFDPSPTEDLMRWGKKKLLVTF